MEEGKIGEGKEIEGVMGNESSSELREGGGRELKRWMNGWNETG